MARTKTAVSKAENDSKAQEKPVKKERKPRAPTAYNNFVKNFYATYEDGEEKPKPKEMISMAAAAWKELTDDEKAEYKTVSTEITIEIKKEKPKKKAESEHKPKKKEGKGGKGLRKGKPASDDEAEEEDEE